MQNQCKILKGLVELPQNLKDMPLPDHFVKPVNRQRLRAEQIYEKLCYALEHDKVFLDSKLSLDKLREIIGTNTTYLSNTINSHFKCNFKTLMNQYRILYFIEKFKDTPADITVQELAKACGFTSVSVFYATFKREIGLPPLRYKFLLQYQSGKAPQEIEIKKRKFMNPHF